MLNTRPPFFGFTPVIPSFYYNVVSEEERTRKICMMLDALQKWAEDFGDEYNDHMREYRSFRKATTKRIEKLEKEVKFLRENLNQIAQQALTYDVTCGLYRPTMTTSRREWDADHFYAMTVTDLSTYTVEEAAELNNRHVIVDGREFYMSEAENDTVLFQYGYSVPNFVPDDYIKRSELTAITDEEIEEGTIMGVPAKFKASQMMKPAPYMRPFNSYDLAKTWVRFDDQLVTSVYNNPEDYISEIDNITTDTEETE